VPCLAVLLLLLLLSFKGVLWVTSVAVEISSIVNVLSMLPSQQNGSVRTDRVVTWQESAGCRLARYRSYKAQVD
jgi:hypothetical protein